MAANLATCWRVRAKRVAGIDRSIVISHHARARIAQRLGWTSNKIRKAAKEVGRIYYNFHSGEKAEIPYKDSIWVVKTAENGQAFVTTPHTKVVGLLGDQIAESNLPQGL